MDKGFILYKLKECKDLWSKYSCDCLHFELTYWENELKKI